MNQLTINEYDDELDELKQFVAEQGMEIRKLKEELDGAYQFIDYLIDRLESNNVNTFD